MNHRFVTLMSMMFILTITSLAGCVRGCRPELEIIGYYENGWGGMFSSSFPSLEKNYRLIDILSPFWYSITPDGELVDPRHQEEVYKFARSKKKRVVVLITNSQAPGSDFPPFLRTPEGRRRAIVNIASVVKKHGYHGVNIDFESISPELREEFTLFIRDLASALRGKIIAVSVVPGVEADEKLSGLYDYEQLGRYATYVVLMAYDKNFQDTAPGPVAPLDWVKKNLDYAIRRIPRDKLVLGIGLYGYDWPVPKSAGVVEYVPTKDLISRASLNGAKIEWDDASQQPFYRYTTAGIKREVWFQSKESAKQRLTLALTYNLRGVALWRLGLEETGFWKVIDQFR